MKARRMEGSTKTATKMPAEKTLKPSNWRCRFWDSNLGLVASSVALASVWTRLVWTKDEMQARRKVLTKPTEKARSQATVIRIQDLKLKVKVLDQCVDQFQTKTDRSGYFWGEHLVFYYDF